MNTELTNKQIDAAWESAPDRQGYARGRSRYDIAHAVIAADRAARIGEFPALPEPDHATVSPWDKDATQMVFFTADQMRAYAAQAVEADRAARGVPDVKTEIEFIQLITQMLVEINPNNYTDDDVSACVQGTIAALNALAVRENTLLAAAPQPAAQPAQRKPLTDEMVVAAARMLSDRQAAACYVDCGDMWKLHGNDFIEDARAALEAAHGIKDAP